MLLSLVFDALCGPQFELVVQIMSHLPVFLGAVVVVVTKEMPQNNSSLLNYSLWYDTHDLRNLFSCMNHNGTCNQGIVLRIFQMTTTYMTLRSQLEDSEDNENN